MDLPKQIKKLPGDRPYSLDTIGMSDAQVICFDDMVLKIEKQCEESENERVMMEWLGDKLPVPRILCAEKEKGLNYLLMSKIRGEISCSKK